jgi:hypothetical protein
MTFPGIGCQMKSCPIWCFLAYRKGEMIFPGKFNRVQFIIGIVREIGCAPNRIRGLVSRFVCKFVRVDGPFLRFVVLADLLGPFPTP